MANKRPKDLPRVTTRTAGDTLILDGATTRSITVENYDTSITLSGANLRMGSDAQGDVLYFNGVNYVRLPAGSSGQFLKTLGAGANPAWAAVPGGGDMLAANFLSEIVGHEQAAQANLGIRKVITTSFSLFVDNALGNDANAGTAGGASAKKTLQSALDAASNNYDFRGNTLTIHVAAGTYTNNALLNRPIVGVASVTITGDTTTPSNCLISVTNDDCIRLDGIPHAVNLEGFKLVTISGGNCISLNNNSTLYLTNKMEYGACASAHRFVVAGSMLVDFANKTINGNPATEHDHVFSGGSMGSDGTTITLTGTPAWGAYFTGVAFGMATYTVCTFSGASTGQKYLVHGDGYIKTAGVVLPGSVAGNSDGGNYEDNIFGGAWTAFSPTPTPQSGSMTASFAGSYKVMGKTVWFHGVITITNAGTGAGGISLAFPVGTSAGAHVCLARDMNITGNTGTGYVQNGGSTFVIGLYNGGVTMINTGSLIAVSGTYEMN